MTVACRYCGGTGTTINANGGRYGCFACKGTGKLFAAENVTNQRPEEHS